MVSTLTSPGSDNKSKSGKKKYKKNALDFVDYETEFKKDPKFKTELCKTFSDTGFCAYGNKCRFAHGREDMFIRSVNHPKYRKSDCLTFHSNGFCNYGARCHFRHHETRILESISRSYFEWGLEIYPETKIKRLPIFERITSVAGAGLYNYDYVRKNYPYSAMCPSIGSVTPFRPKNFSERDSSVSSNSVQSRSPINSPDQSMLYWKVNRKLNFNDVRLSDTGNGDITLYQ